MKPLGGGGGGYTGIRTRGVTLAKYRSLTLIIIFVISQVALLSVSDHFVLKTNPVPCPHEYIYIKSPMDWIVYPSLYL